MRIASTLAALAALIIPAHTIAATGVAEKYTHYYAAVEAQKRGDCAAVVRNLEEFLRRHPDVSEKYPVFYLDLKFVMGQCRGIIIRGVGEETAEMEPLPELPPIGD